MDSEHPLLQNDRFLENRLLNATYLVGRRQFNIPQKCQTKMPGLSLSFVNFQGIRFTFMPLAKNTSVGCSGSIFGTFWRHNLPMKARCVRNGKGV